MPTDLPPHVLHLTRTACLVESRAHLYSGYLANVFRARGPRWREKFERWGEEEQTHGASLRAFLAQEDPRFDFARHLDDYLAHVPYHCDVEKSVYGSEQAELVARCFVEAMAASYYQALGSGAAVLQPLCRRLAADEARHFTMFRRLLETLREEEGARPLEAMHVLTKRLRALDDEQILYASWCVRGAQAPYVREEESKRYRAMIWQLYRPEHVRFVATLSLQTLGLSVAPARLHRLSALVHGVLSRGEEAGSLFPPC
ncbi:MAG: hypothetical protein Q8L48_10525 [Archangium sp.]|nr:hypothetical protein [Archangium sp.]